MKKEQDEIFDHNNKVFNPKRDDLKRSDKNKSTTKSANLKGKVILNENSLINSQLLKNNTVGFGNGIINKENDPERYEDLIDKLTLMNLKKALTPKNNNDVCIIKEENIKYLSNTFKIQKKHRTNNLSVLINIISG